MRQVGTHLDDATSSLLSAAPSDERALQARKARIKTLPPPPPLAAFVQRIERPAAIEHEAQVSLPSLPPSLPSQRASLPDLPRIVPSPNSDWTELSSHHFGSSVRAPKPQARPWGSILALGLGAASVLGAGFSVGLARHHEQTANARASIQRSALAYVAPSHPAILASTSLAAAHPVSHTAVALPAHASVSQPLSATLKKPEPVRELPPTAAATLPAAPSPAAAIEPAPTAHASKQPATIIEPKPQQVEPNDDDDESIADVAVNAHASAEPAEDLPEQPSRDDIKHAFEALRPALQACSADTHGTTFANVTIAGNGHVSYSSIEGAFAGSPQGSCMARALRSASFPRFANASLKVRFPFVL